MGSCLSSEGATYSSTSTTMGGEGGVRRKPWRKKNGAKRCYSFEERRNDWLFKIPGRMFANGASDVASCFTKQGRKGINQDAMIVWENFGSKEDTIFCGVFDGHGPYGHVVAKRVRDILPLKLNAQWELVSGNKDGSSDVSSSVMGSKSCEVPSCTLVGEESKTTNGHDREDSIPDIFYVMKDSFLKACKVMDKELKLHPKIDCYCSGTTAVTLIKKGRDLVIGNIGDSRAVLGTRDKDDSLVAVQLTVDLKPNLPNEADRIRQHRGRVFAIQSEPEVARVWLPNMNSPGLAMSRALGDFCLKDFGLISVPEMSYHHVTEKDEFVVLATDGIWDVLSNEEVVNMVASTPRALAAEALVELAIRAWRFKYPTSRVDDCGVVCLFLNLESSNSSVPIPTPIEQAATPLAEIN